MFETVAIFEQIEAEKEKAGANTLCIEPTGGPCWRLFDGERGLFVPSPATVGRLAALTQALRPYRYLQVEGGDQGFCPAETASQTLDAAYERLLETRIAHSAHGETAALTLESARSIAAAIYHGTNRDRVQKTQSWIGRIITELAGGETTLDAALNCGPSSPERGQLLVSLHAAGVDISAIENGGGNFTYSDIPGANLTGIRLNGVSLNNSRLPGASFANAILDEVHFRGADLNGARFADAAIANADFEGARIQIFDKPGDAPWFFLPKSAANTMVSGVRVFEQTWSPALFDRICLSLQLPSAFTLPSVRGDIVESVANRLSFVDISDHGVLIETRNRNDGGGSSQRAILMFGLGLERAILWSSKRIDVEINLEYIPLLSCDDDLSR